MKKFQLKNSINNYIHEFEKNQKTESYFFRHYLLVYLINIRKYLRFTPELFRKSIKWVNISLVATLFLTARQAK